jgi:hypothetical protein
VNSRLAAAAALSVAASCYLSACTNDHRRPATAPSSSPAAHPSRTPAPLPTRPPSPAPVADGDFAIPADVKVTIDEDTAGDPLKDEVLRYNRKLILSLLDAEAGDGPTDPTYKPFVVGAAETAHIKEMAGYLEKNWTVTGEIRFWKRSVKITAPDRAMVLYCEDQRYFYAKDRTTKKILLTTPSRKSFIQHIDVMVKAPGGEWRQSEYQWTRSVENCQRPLDAPV